MKVTVTITGKHPARTIEMSLEDYVTFIEEQAIQLSLLPRPKYRVGFDSGRVGRDFTPAPAYPGANIRRDK